MPCKQDHLSLASHNQNTIQYLLKDINTFSDWIVIVAFYKAIHMIEALRAHAFKDHSHSHESREIFLKSQNRFYSLYRNYTALKEAAQIARYLNSKCNGDFSSFSQYLSPQDVKSQILDHELPHFESTLNKFLGRPPSQLKP